MMKKTPESIKADLRYYKFENNLYCRNCKQYRAKFTYIKIEADKINFIFNCNCGQDFQYSMSYETLRKTFYRYTYAKESGNLATLWRCFRLGLYFNQVFKFAHEKKQFEKIVCRLNKDTSGIRDFYYRMKHASS
jgi:hypothetical protein